MIPLSQVESQDRSMLAVSPARNATRDDCNAASQTSCGFKTDMEEDFLDLGDQGDLLDIIDFDDLFGVAGDVLPDLEMFSDNMNASSSSEEKTHEEEKRKHSKKNKSNKEGKRKVKVDWTPELHRRFVEAVEQLGVDKAVPSRILELMGVHCLTRHNVASHLQKYRSHRKHLLAREAEAANWTRKRQIYGVDAARNKNGWLATAAPTIGFPPVHHHFSRPLHVWGHPTVDQWPKHLPSTPPFWLSDSPYWLPAIHSGTTPYLPTVATRFRAPPVAGIPQALSPRHTVYKADHGFRAARPPMDLHPSKETVDAAIGDVLTRPWLPLPLGLKPPAVDGVMTELHRHGVSEVPPTASCA